MTAALATFVPRDYDIFVGLDVDQRSMAITFTDHGTMQKSLKLPYSATQLLNYTEKHFLGSAWPSFMRRGQPVLAYMTNSGLRTSFAW
jgi:hypothetical protein